VEATLAGLEKMTIKSNNGMRSKREQSDPKAVCEFENPNGMNNFNSMNSSMLSIPEAGFVDKRVTRADEQRCDTGDQRVQQQEYYNRNNSVSGDWDDTASVSSYRSYRTVDTAASSESVQSIIQRLNSETDRRRRRLRRRRSMRSSGSSVGSDVVRERKVEEPMSPRGFTVHF